MLSHTGTLWHYLGSFVFYTLLAIGLIYGAYWYSRKATGGLLAIKKIELTEDPNKLELESTLALEPNNNLYVVRSGKERFLISASGEKTQLLSKLEPIATEEPEAVEDPVVELPTERPWYSDVPSSRIQQAHKPGFGSRFVQSVQWLVASRSKMR